MSNTSSVVLFQKSLTDLVKGIRSQRSDPSQFISQVIAECKQELSGTDAYLKAEALRKLTYLQMIGYNISWASFFIIEVMSQGKFEHKRIGYLAANQSFTESTDVILLTTNLFKKEFTSQSSLFNSYEVGLAINCLSNIATKDLARDCMSDIVTLLNHSKAYIRKKAVICLYKLYLKYPPGLRLTFDQLKDRLDDSDPSVVSCTVNVICELAKKNPKNYLSMAPKFFQLLTTSSNNWMLIKVVKLFSSLVKEEPRLARKLLEPLTTIITNTTAKSLQYECISTITLSLPYTKREDGSEVKNISSILSLCVQQLQSLVKDNDQNLKYLGLVGLLQLMASHPRLVMEQKEMILSCLSDEDETVRGKALELIAGIVTKKSLVDFVHQLLRHLRTAEGSYRDNIISTILTMGGTDRFSLVTDFIWYVSVLQRLACIQGGGATVSGLLHSNQRPHHGKQVAEQLVEISLRVKTVRAFAVECMVTMLIDGGKLILGQARDTVSEVMMAAAWICGEYSEILIHIMLDLKDENDEEEDEEDEDDQGYWIEGPEGDEIRSKWRGKPLLVMAIACLLHPRSTNLPGNVQSAFLHAVMKMFIRACDGRCSQEYLAQIIACLRSRLPVYLQSVYLEVQERASTLRYLLAETGILAVDAGQESTKGKQSQSINGDLLSFQEIDKVAGDDINVSEIRVISADITGASIAQRSYRFLQAIISEEFFSVHPKAQRKVQVPEGLNLSQPFNKKATEELLASDPANRECNFSTLSFTQTSRIHNHDSSHLTSRPIPNHVASIKDEPKDFYQDDPPQKTKTSYESDHLISSLTTTNSSNSSSKESRTFYLQRNEQPEDEEDTDKSQFTEGLQSIHTIGQTETRKKKRSHKSSKSGSKKKHDIINEMIIPHGAEEDNDENNNIFRSNPGNEHDEDYEDLENIDLTKPLRPGESLPVFKHREISSNNDNPGIEVTEVTQGGDGKDEEKKTKKRKKEKKRKESSTRSIDTSVNLLGLGMDSPPLIQTASASSSTLGTKPKKRIWFPVISQNKAYQIDYSFDRISFNSRDIGQLYLIFRICNDQSDGSTLSADISISSNSSGFYRLSSGKCHLARSLKSGSHEEKVVTLDVAPTINPLQTNMVECLISLEMESLIGIESLKPIALTIPLFVTLFFEPFSVSETEFQSFLTANSQSIGSSRTKLQPTSTSSSKAKKALKSIVQFLHAFEVENINDQSLSLCAKYQRNNLTITICSLVKILPDHTIAIDIKCLGVGQPQSSQQNFYQSVANEITAALVVIPL